jgi:CubicO group peptidase (beta-lactamase class C family)
MSSSNPAADVDGNKESAPSTLGLMDGEFDALVQKLLDEHHVPGMSIAIVRNGDIQCKVRLSGYHEYAF